jgi:hypothetical protein
MDEKSNAVLQEIMDAGKAALHERHVRNAALEDAAIVCEVFAEVNERLSRNATDVGLMREKEDRVKLCRKIAETIRSRKDFGPKPVTTSTPN